jgi:hypothetical protein
MEKEREQGTFLSDLTRNFKDLKRSYAEACNEDLETAYRRKIEDLCRDIRKCEREREDQILKLSPTHAGSAKLESIDATQFCEEDINIGVAKRNLVIKLEITLERYEKLFGRLEGDSAVRKILPYWVSIYDLPAKADGGE